MPKTVFERDKKQEAPKTFKGLREVNYIHDYSLCGREIKSLYNANGFRFEFKHAMSHTAAVDTDPLCMLAMQSSVYLLKSDVQLRVPVSIAEQNDKHPLVNNMFQEYVALTTLSSTPKGTSL